MVSAGLAHFSARNSSALLIGAACVVVVGVLAYVAYTQILKYELLAADPGTITTDSGLARFADNLARPAWSTNCAGCHGADMKGDRARGVPDLTDADWIYGAGAVSQIEYTITYGIRAGIPKSRNLAFMPSFEHPNDPKEKLTPLSPSEIKDVIAFVFSLEGRPADPGAAARGALIYSDKGACYDCHASDGRGDHDVGAPNLADKTWLYGDGSEAALFKSIEKGHAGICPAWIGRLSPVVIRALAVLVHDRSQAKIAEGS